MLVITLFCIGLFVLDQNTVASTSQLSDNNQLTKVDQIIESNDVLQKNVNNQ